jgi:hypothetical protein
MSQCATGMINPEFSSNCQRNRRQATTQKAAGAEELLKPAKQPNSSRRGRRPKTPDGTQHLPKERCAAHFGISKPPALPPRLRPWAFGGRPLRGLGARFGSPLDYHSLRFVFIIPPAGGVNDATGRRAGSGRRAACSPVGYAPGSPRKASLWTAHRIAPAFRPRDQGPRARCRPWGLGLFAAGEKGLKACRGPRARPSQA